jgi:hypothetical protein
MTSQHSSEYLREYYDDAIAVEMEGFGFLKATQQVKNVSAMGHWFRWIGTLKALINSC